MTASISNKIPVPIAIVVGTTHCKKNYLSAGLVCLLQEAYIVSGNINKSIL